jgi:hypothetical protein
MSRKSGYSALILVDPKQILSVFIEAKAGKFYSRKPGRFEISFYK